VFGVSASDAIALAVVAATLAIVALCASLVPAWRGGAVSVKESQLDASLSHASNQNEVPARFGLAIVQPETSATN
jgi:hypothetical protein